MRKPPGAIGIGAAMLIACAALAASPEAATGQDDATADGPDIVVQGIPPRCQPRAGDPMDAIDLSVARSGKQQIVERDPETGGFRLAPDNYPLGTPDDWQRDGTRLDQYVFRVPAARDRPVCIGARSRYSPGFAQLRRAFPARPYWGRYVILTVRVATRKAEQVEMWIAAGAPLNDRKPLSNIVAGGSKRVPITGSYRWRTLNFLMGPVPCMAEQISWGVTLRGGGDVWLSKPRLVMVPDDRLSPSMQERPHGQAMLNQDPICQHHLSGKPIWQERNGSYFPITDPRQVTTGKRLYFRKEGQFVPIRYDQALAPGLVEF